LLRGSNFTDPQNPPKIEIKQSKRPKESKNQIPLPSHLSHPTPKWNQNNQCERPLPHPQRAASLCVAISHAEAMCTATVLILSLSLGPARS
jgi:hypothetical protein